MTAHVASRDGPADPDLVQRVVGGDGSAFGLIVERYQDRLYNTIVRLVGSAEDARDLLQDTFVKAYENLEGFHGASSLYTWLFRIAVNTSLSHRRRRQGNRRMVSLNPGEETDLADRCADPGAPDPADPLLAAETEAQIQRALDALDEEHRAVVILRDVQHCDYHQIAQILDVPTGTVKSRLHRARLMLREKLEPLLKR